MVELLAWNVNGRQVWDHLTEDDSLDVALLQEAPQPQAGVFRSCDPDPDSDWTTAHWPRPLRTCVGRLSDRVELVPRPLRDAHQEDYAALGVSRRGTLTIADVRRKDELLFTVASAYAAWEQPPSLSDKYIYADASAHRLLSDLAAILTGRRGEQIVVAGDFNILLGYGEHGDAYWEARYQSVFDRARAMGLVFVGPQAPRGRQASPWPEELPQGSSNVPTFHHSRQTPETATRQLDFVFATANIADQVTVRALNAVDEWGPSDHCRIAITVDV